VISRARLGWRRLVGNLRHASRILGRLRELLRPTALRLTVRHVHGPRRIEYDGAEVVAICVVRDGEPYVRSFLDHHFALGVKHVVLLLNDSTDGTAVIAATYPNVTLLRTRRSYAQYENLMKRYLAQRFSMNRWSLCVDIDELFDYPQSGDVPLCAILAYLDNQEYTAVVAQMLDMFADGPLASVRSQPEDRLRDVYPFYDTSAVRKTDYIYSRLTNHQVKMHWGGIRAQAFGTNNGLSKACLVKVAPDMELFVDWHHVMGATVADFTAVLLHYPFVETFAAKVAEAVSTGRYGPHTTREYGRYEYGLRQSGEIILRQQSARHLTDISELLDDGFLVAGPAFTAWRQRYLATIPR
jgi:hypothetical protein